jgi:endonuclease/exonuclease/phosphatase family metal-dependent hydrolase
MMSVRSALRLMTYNIRHGRGADGKVDLGRIADVIASYAPDVVALQEVDVGRARSGAEDQAEALARRLGMAEARFAPCVIHGEKEHYGIATLARAPFSVVRQMQLPGGGRWLSEPRSALLTTIATGDGTIDLINTHLSLNYVERGLQVAAITGEFQSDELIVAGDLNCTQMSAPYRRFAAYLQSAVRRATWPARFPVVQLDHLLYRGRLAVSDQGTITSEAGRRASDHLPLVATFAYADAARRSA